MPPLESDSSDYGKSGSHTTLPAVMFKGQLETWRSINSLYVKFCPENYPGIVLQIAQSAPDALKLMHSVIIMQRISHLPDADLPIPALLGYGIDGAEQAFPIAKQNDTGIIFSVAFGVEQASLVRLSDLGVDEAVHYTHQLQAIKAKLEQLSFTTRHGFMFNEDPREILVDRLGGQVVALLSWECVDGTSDAETQTYTAIKTSKLEVEEGRVVGVKEVVGKVTRAVPAEIDALAKRMREHPTVRGHEFGDHLTIMFVCSQRRAVWCKIGLPIASRDIAYQNEALCLTWLQDTAMQEYTPELIAQGVIQNGSFVICTAHVDGIRMDGLNETDAHELLPLVEEAMGKMRTITCIEVRSFALEAPLAPLLQRARVKLCPYGYNSYINCLSHGDLSQQNILAARDKDGRWKPWFIDWEGARFLPKRLPEPRFFESSAYTAIQLGSFSFEAQQVAEVMRGLERGRCRACLIRVLEVVLSLAKRYLHFLGVF